MTSPKGLEILAKTWIPTFTRYPAHFLRFRYSKALEPKANSPQVLGNGKAIWRIRVKAGFLSPLEILASDEALLSRVGKKVSSSIGTKVNWELVYEVLQSIFGQIFEDQQEYGALTVFESSTNLARNGYYRTDFTSELISRFLAGVEAKPDKECPPLSTVRLNNGTLLAVEVLKHYNYEATIMSSRLKIAEYRGYQIVKSIFDNLSKERGYLLLPDDFREQFEAFSELAPKKRVICDFVAGMTDRYAVEFYGRLNSEQHQSIFKPL